MQSELLGVDIGGTQFRMGFVTDDGGVIGHKSLPTPSFSTSYDAFTDLRQLIDPDRHATKLVVGVPGVVDYKEQRLIYAPNIPQNFVPELNSKAISEKLQVETLLVNDADLAAIGEANFGAGRESESMAYVTISTGVGAAVVVDKHLLRSRHSIAELGHSFIDANSANVDGVGSVELMASGTALAMIAKEKKILLSNAEIVKRATDGDRECSQLVEGLAHNTAVSMANMVHLFSVDTIVLGGGVSLSGDYFFDLAVAKFNRLCPPYFSVKVKRAELGDEAGLAGAGAAFSAFEMN
ncbi:MAG: ROK family protein [Actinomycetota bacterium]|nr:ROK family protein [Actinomycetota bacterium]